jgi:hypothetical protein
MSVQTGRLGLIKADNSTVAEVRSFTIYKTATLEDETGIDEDWKRFFVSNTEWSADIDIFWEENNTNLFPIGSELEAIFYADGSSVSNTRWFGNAIVISRTITANFDGMVEAKIGLLGDGDLTEVIGNDPLFDNIEMEDGFNLLQENFGLIVLE